MIASAVGAPKGADSDSHHPLQKFYTDLRVWLNGRASAFQAECVGSIPITRSNKRSRKISSSYGKRRIGTHVGSCERSEAGAFPSPAQVWVISSVG